MGRGWFKIFQTLLNNYCFEEDLMLTLEQTKPSFLSCLLYDFDYQDHAKMLQQRAVAYLNVDIAVEGSCSHSIVKWLDVTFPVLIAK